MALIEWSNNYSVDNETIDKQHQKLFDYLNELADSMAIGKANEKINVVLDHLISYTTTHFKHEEDLFDKYDYPETDSHKEKHANFAAKVIQFKEDFEHGRALLSVKILRFLTSWLIEHICGADKEYIDFFNKNGWE